MSKTQMFGISLAIVSAILWGFSGVGAQFLFEYRNVDFVWLGTVRQLISGLLLLSFAKYKKLPLMEVWKDKKDITQIFIFATVGLLAMQYTYFAAIKHSNAATACVLHYIAPVLIIIYITIRDKKRPALNETVAITLAVLGTFLLVTHGNIGYLSISKEALFWGIASAFGLAFYNLYPVRLLSKFNVIVITGWSMTIAGLFYCFLCPPWRISGEWDFLAIFVFISIAIVGSTMAYCASLTAIRIIGAQKTSIISTVEPLSAAIISVALLGVPFGIFDWTGSLLIISTVIILARA